MPLLGRGADVRIANLSSLGHNRDRVHFDDPNCQRREYEK